MKRRSFCYSLLFFFTLIVLGSLQPIYAQSKPALTPKGVVSTDKVRQGSSFQLAIVLDIDQAFHINSNKPTDPNLIPTKVEITQT
ncbi:MAG: hypothetical protein AB1489_24945, partial [Acidobacteriota bacterium]